MLFKYELLKLFRNKLIIIMLCAGFVISFAVGIGEQVTEVENYGTRFTKRIDTVIYSAKTNYRQIDDKKSEMALYQLGVLEKYSALTDVDVSSRVRGFEAALSTAYPYALSLAVGVFAAIAAAHSEYRSSLVLLTNKKGRYKICACKMASVALVVFICGLAFVAAALAGAFVCTGVSGFFAPIQSIPTYMLCPYDMSVAAAILCRFGIAFVLILCVCLAVFCAGLMLRRFHLAVLGVVLICSTEILRSSLIEDAFSFFGNFAITDFISDEWLLRYKGMKIAGVFVSQPLVALFFAAVLIAVLALAAMLLFKRARTVLTVKNARGEKHARARGGAYGYEIKKMLSGSAIVIFICLLVIHTLTLAVVYRDDGRDYEKIYKYHVLQMSEMSFDEQRAYVIDERIRSAEQVSEARRLKEKFTNGECTEAEYSAALQRAGLADITNNVLRDIDKQLDSLGKLIEQGMDAKLVYAVGWTGLINKPQDFFLIAALVLILVPYVNTENDSGFIRVLNANLRTNRKAMARHRRRKAAVAFAVSLAVISLFNATDVAFFALRFGLPSATAYAAGAGVEFACLGIRLWQALACKLALSLLGALLIVAFSSCASRLVSSTPKLVALLLGVGGVLFVAAKLVPQLTVVDVTSYFGCALLFEASWAVLLGHLSLLAVLCVPIAVEHIKTDV